MFMKKILLYSVLVAGMLSSCDLNINDDPDYPTNDQVTADLIFPAAQTLVASNIGGEIFNFSGFFAQYFEQRPEASQYDALPTYAFTEASDIMNYGYSSLMAGAQKDLKDVIDKSENPADRYAATILRAYVYQVMVDNFDRFPYKESLLGADNLNPAWDEGADVYKGVLDEMDKAEQELGENPAMDSEDLMFDGNVSQWKGFANALRLRMYLRFISGGIDASSYEQKVKDLVAENKFFTGDVCFSGFADESNKRNPWYETNAMGLTGNHCAAYPLVEYLKGMDDPRISYGLNEATATNEYVGQLPGGKMNTRTAKGNTNLWMNRHVSAINYEPAATMPVYYFTQAELQFLIAEVYLKYVKDDGKAKTAYEKGIAADFDSREVDGAADFIAGKVPWTGNEDEKMELIGKQKWVALFYRDHMESWSELRRTGYPKYVALTEAELTAIATGGDAPAAKYNLGDLIVPWQNDMINSVGDKVVKRIYYPLSARRYNKNTPQSPSLDTPVWWDKN